MKSKILFLLMFSFPCVIFSQTNQPKTPNEVVALIRKNVTCDWANETVDKFKAGNPETVLKGIAVCMFADMGTLREAPSQRCKTAYLFLKIFYQRPLPLYTLCHHQAHIHSAAYISSKKAIRHTDYWNQNLCQFCTSIY